jgi:hypothetical protein
MKMSIIAAIPVVLLPIQAAATPLTIDFDELQSADALVRAIGPVYEIDGFVFTATVPSYAGNTPNFNTVGTFSTSFYGSTPLVNGNAMGGTRLTRADGGIFDLISIDLVEMPSFDPFGSPIDQGSFALTFVGTRADSSTVLGTATIAPFSTVTTFTFSEFKNLVSVEWLQGGPAHQFDNVRVEAVPEPSTLSLLCLGVLGAASVLRRTPLSEL